tara:strand:+ start:42 stop:950 length:909 start_codon:yes stop_codon:yes gene_type:complete
MDVVVFQSLWIGDSLSNIEQLCLASFVANGAEMHLYSYGVVDNVPRGVIVCDANAIIPEGEIFRYKNGSVSAFSNLFRFTLLFKKGGIWVDSDVLCVSPLFKWITTTEYLFASESSYKDSDAVNPSSFIIKMPKGCRAAKKAIRLQNHDKTLILSGELKWGSGPKTVRKIIAEFGLERFIVNWKVVSTCGWRDARSLTDPYYQGDKKHHGDRSLARTVNEISPESRVIHLWNEMWRRQGLDKNTCFSHDSIIETFRRKYGYTVELSPENESRYRLERKYQLAVSKGKKDKAAAIRILIDKMV